MADEIDAALARAMYHEQLDQLAGEVPWDQLTQLGAAQATWLAKAVTVRIMLARCGHVIVPATDELLRRGEETVKGGKTHD